MAKNKLQIEIDVASDKGVKNLDKVNKGIKETGDSAETSGAGFAQMAVGIAAAGAALAILIKFGKEFVEGAQKQELAEKGLEIALKKQGDAAGVAFKSLKKLASARQGITTVGDEATLAFANILILGGQAAEQVEELIPTIQDLGAAYELAGNGTADYSKIALTINKIIKTGAGDLSRYGVVLTAVEKKTIIAATEAERQAIIMDKVSAAAGGMAEVLAETSSGQMTQFDNIVGDIKENLGFLIIDFIMPAVTWFKKIAAALSDVTDRGSDTTSVVRTIIDVFKVWNELTFAVLEIMGDLIGLLFELVGAGQAAGGAMDFLRKAIRVVRLAILLLRSGAAGTIALLRELKEVAVDFWDAITSLDFASLGDILAGGAERMSGAFKKGFKGVVDDFNETQKKLAEGGGLANTIMTGKTGKAGKAAAALEFPALDVLLEKTEDTFSQLLIMNSEIDEKIRKLKIENMEEGLSKEFAMIQEAMEQELILAEDSEELKEQIREKFRRKRRAAEDKRSQEAKQREAERSQAIEAGLKKVFAMTGDVFGETWEGKKAFRLSEATMAVALAVTENLANPGIAALIGILGAIQIAKIAAEKKPSFAGGGFTGSGPQDQVAGAVHGQEFVSNATATAQHRTGLELVNAGISPQEAFDLELPGNVPTQSGSSEIILKADFVLDGQVARLLIEQAIQAQRTGTV